MNKKKTFNPNTDFSLLAAFSLLLFVLVIVSFVKESNPQWKRYQQDFRNYIEEKIGPEAASSVEFSIKQLWMPDLNRVDRCISCHLGYDNPELADAPQPFRTHPDIAPHLTAQYGCTICHGGQGFALKKKDAHGEIKHWEEPLLGTSLAEKYGIENKNSLIQINCNICHRHEREVPGMSMINQAKNLMEANKKCRTCHIIDGAGGKISSDLTYVGEKSPERFDFSKIEHKILERGRPLSMLTWHFEHFMDPAAVVAGSQMPKVNYTEEEAWSLAMLMMSWRKENLPVMMIPGEAKESEPSEAEATDRGDMSLEEWGSALFQAKNCAECHTIGGGVEIGPDLKSVTEKRDIDWLRRMIGDPELMEQTDPLAQQLYGEYEELGMPTEELSDEEINAIIAYIRSASKT